MTTPSNDVLTKQFSIVFLKVPDNESKIASICQTVQRHFEQNQAILITVPSEEAARYVDQLLWRYPEESFLPHQIATSASSMPIVITTAMNNLNKAQVLFNLCPTASPIYTQFTTVYELLDETHPEKLRLSQLRQSTYQAQGVPCLSHTIE